LIGRQECQPASPFFFFPPFFSFPFPLPPSPQGNERRWKEDQRGGPLLPFFFFLERSFFLLFPPFPDLNERKGEEGNARSLPQRFSPLLPFLCRAQEEVKVISVPFPRIPHLTSPFLFFFPLSERTEGKEEKWWCFKPLFLFSFLKLFLVPPPLFFFFPFPLTGGDIE